MRPSVEKSTPRRCGSPSSVRFLPQRPRPHPPCRCRNRSKQRSRRRRMRPRSRCSDRSFAAGRTSSRGAGRTRRPAGRATRRRATTSGTGGLCEKKKGAGAGRRATCGECPNQAFIPVSDEEVARHLRGDQVMGVYPLLPRRDLLVPRRRLRQEDLAGGRRGVRRDLPTARRAGRDRALALGQRRARLVLLRVAGVRRSRRASSAASSSPRRWPGGTSSRWSPTTGCFPNQDTMPKGGFGNLIALPLQRGRATRATPCSSTTPSGRGPTSGPSSPA